VLELERFAVKLTQGSCVGLTILDPRAGSCLQRFPGDARVRRAKSGRAGGEHNRETLARKLDDGAWQPENTRCVGVWRRVRVPGS
jgi:hypothetical protein